MVEFKERVFPSFTLIGFGLLITAVLSVAAAYAINFTTGIVLAVFFSAVTIASFFRLGHSIELNDNLSVGKYSLALSCIGDASAFSGLEALEVYRKELKTTDLYLSVPGVTNFVRIKLDDNRDPYQVWFIASRKPELLARKLKN